MMAINGLSKDDDMPKLFEYLIKYASDIEDYKGCFDFKDKMVDKFFKQNNIFYGSYNIENLKKKKRYLWYLLFEQRKNSKKSGSDIAHHLFRHIRNAIAHANIEKINSRINNVNHQIYRMKDFNIQGNTQTMDSFIETKLFYKLLDLLFATRTV